MAGSVSPGRGGIVGINITPMVDIMLVLLVIFMVTTTAITESENIPIDKPDAATGQSSSEPSPTLHIVCGSDGALAVDGETVKPGQLGAVLASRSYDEETQAVLACDEAASVGQLVRIIDALRIAGINRYAVATEQPPEPAE
jgi:biopolymer transport protein ExbD